MNKCTKMITSCSIRRVGLLLTAFLKSTWQERPKQIYQKYLQERLKNCSKVGMQRTGSAVTCRGDVLSSPFAGGPGNSLRGKRAVPGHARRSTHPSFRVRILFDEALLHLLVCAICSSCGNSGKKG